VQPVTASSPRARRTSAQTATRWLRVLAVSTLVATYLLIVLGSTVRVTNSGMGCPGWPLCYGQIGPVDHLHSLLEQSHRYLASIVTLLAVSLGLAAWRAGPAGRHVRAPAFVGVATIVVQIVLGAVTVVTHNSPPTVALHLGVALIFLAITTFAAVASFVPPEVSWSPLRPPSPMAWAAVGGLFLVMVSGSLVVNGGAEKACSSWPLCGGSPAAGGLIALQLAHRAVVLIGGGLVALYFGTALVRRPLDTGIPWGDNDRPDGAAEDDPPRHDPLLLTGLALLIGEVAAGAMVALLGAPEGAEDVHLAIGAALWAVLVAVALRSSLRRATVRTR
jgi:cytochrome c oxidase assembly protein subunit 15